jgi:mono/diheme cytochrome c family protein
MRFLAFLVLAVLLLGACSPSTTTGSSAETLAPGDTARGAELFAQVLGGAPSCSTCHTLNGEALVGPSLQGLAAVASTRVDNLSAEEYIHTSIVQPSAYIVSGFTNTMFNQYAQRLTPQQIADLVAYLLTL